MKIGKVISIILIILAVLCFIRAGAGVAEYVLSRGDDAYLETAIIGAPLGIFLLIIGIVVKNKSK